ncbi:unnamed protein product [Cuscuta epithymum]|uniref:Uncharacterized protein n=1 Tax=Cuscuta epithymum TaxID=186058 RepID=A0AAV0EF00_9ASTE|nr:unnamed protein product [Cuscuta epithymum]
MEKSNGQSYKQQPGGCPIPTSSSSSFITDLFGPLNDHSNLPPTTGQWMGRNGVVPFSRMHNSGGRQNPESSEDEHRQFEDKSYVYYSDELTSPYYSSSSLYYGGQDISFPSTNITNPHCSVTISSLEQFNKDGGEDDKNGVFNPNLANRGDWWLGSLYY